jgi:hypothetical protein
VDGRRAEFGHFMIPVYAGKKWTVPDVWPLYDFKKETLVTRRVLTPKVLTRGFCSSQTTIIIHLPS